jgi:hypothetical protein
LLFSTNKLIFKKNRVKGSSDIMVVNGFLEAKQKIINKLKKRIMKPLEDSQVNAKRSRYTKKMCLNYLNNGYTKEMLKAANLNCRWLEQQERNFIRQSLKNEL